MKEGVDDNISDTFSDTSLKQGGRFLCVLVTNLSMMGLWYISSASFLSSGPTSLSSRCTKCGKRDTMNNLEVWKRWLSHLEPRKLVDLVQYSDTNQSIKKVTQDLDEFGTSEFTCIVNSRRKCLHSETTERWGCPSETSILGWDTSAAISWPRDTIRWSATKNRTHRYRFYACEFDRRMKLIQDLTYLAMIHPEQLQFGQKRHDSLGGDVVVIADQIRQFRELAQEVQTPTKQFD